MGPGGGDHLQRLHGHAGVELRLGRRLIATHGEHTLELDDGTLVEADLFLAAVGVRPDTAWTGGYTAPNVHGAGDATGQAHWEAARARAPPPPARCSASPPAPKRRRSSGPTSTASDPARRRPARRRADRRSDLRPRRAPRRRRADEPTWRARRGAPPIDTPTREAA